MLHSSIPLAQLKQNNKKIEIMKTNKYIAPQVEVIEIEIEDVVLSSSNIEGTTVEDFISGTGRY